MPDPAALEREVEELRRRLLEAQETLLAIQGGEVDAVVVNHDESPQILTLDAADRPYRLLVKQMHQGAAILTIDGMVLACNEHFGRLLRAPLESLHARPSQALVDESSRPRFEALLRDGLAASVEGEVVMCRGDGTRVPLILGVRALHEGVAGVCLLVADLTDQKRRERLVADEAMARAIFEQVADVVIVCDGAGTVLRASRAARDLCGTNPAFKRFDEVLSLTRLRPDGTLGEHVDVDAALRGETLRGWEVSFVRPDGQRAALLLSAGPLVAAGGETLGAVVTLTEITQLRAAQGELRRRAEELQAADQRKDEFLAMLAHELRNPLAPIRSSLEIMHLKAVDDPLTRKCRDVIGRQVDQLTRLVDDLLEVSRISSGKIQLRVQRVDLTAAVTRGVETSRPVVDAKDHRVTMSAPEAPIWVQADLTRVAQVVGNIVHNAAKYTENGGQIDVKVEQQGAFGVVRVRDSGIGIPREMLGLVFDLFTQVSRSIDRSQGGLGIGLALVKRLVQMHGGQVEARSDGPGRGSEFIVRLPLWTAERSGGVEAPTAAAASPQTGLRVLLVEDNQDAAEILAELLSILGHQIRTAHDGPSGIAAADEFDPEVVLCDIGLPGKDGYQVVGELRQRPRLAGTRFVALTGYGREEDRQRSLAAGFHAHLVKPVDLEMLTRALQTGPRAAGDGLR